MPFWLIALLAGSTVALVAAASSKTPNIVLLRGGLKFAPQKPNRFVDPVLLALANEKGIYPQIGLGYLAGLPNNADAVIDAIRKRVGAAPPPRVSFPNTTIGALADNSFKNVQDLGVRLQSIYADASQWGQLASQFGVPVDEIKAQAANLNGIVGKVEQTQFIQQAAQYLPVATTLMQGVGGFASGKSSREDIALNLGVSAASVLAAAAANVVPVVGAVMNLAISSFSAAMAASAKLKGDACNTRRNAISDASSKTAAEHFPFPLHLAADFGDPCGNDWNGAFVENALRGNLLAYRSLSVRDKGAVMQWWALTLSLMSHPEVYAVFDKLGHGQHPLTIGNIANEYGTYAPPFGDGFGRLGLLGLYGGTVASDEQVMMVAAPYAIANGFPVDHFAKALWSKSAGWAGADPISFMFSKERDQQLRAAWQKDKGDIMSEIVTRFGAHTPLNAWHLQFAVLARDAQELVRTLQKP